MVSVKDLARANLIGRHLGNDLGDVVRERALERESEQHMAESQPSGGNIDHDANLGDVASPAQTPTLDRRVTDDRAVLYRYDRANSSGFGLVNPVSDVGDVGDVALLEEQILVGLSASEVQQGVAVVGRQVPEPDRALAAAQVAGQLMHLKVWSRRHDAPSHCWQRLIAELSW